MMTKHSPCPCWVWHVAASLATLLLPSASLDAQQTDEVLLDSYRAAAMRAADPDRGKTVFSSQQAGCNKCHEIETDDLRAGPKLNTIGDKYSREQLVDELLLPSARIHPDYATTIVVTSDGKTHTGVLRRRNEQELQLFDADGKLITIARSDVTEEQRSGASLMPVGLTKTLSPENFADLVAYLGTLRQKDRRAYPGMPDEIPAVAKSVRLVPLHSGAMRFDHPVWIIRKPNTTDAFLVVEQKTRKIWCLTKDAHGDRKELFADLSDEASTGEFEGVMCLAFHPRFVENRRYFVNYHVRESGRFSPVIVERRATQDLQRDAGGASRRLLQIPQNTDLHWGGMLAFGPDGYLYIGTGDGGPQEDPDGNSQDPSSLLGAILRIDVDRSTNGKPYAIPPSNPFLDNSTDVRPEIWAYGLRMPWRFSFDSETDDLWVGEIGQTLFEEVSLVRAGENHGWNVFEGFVEFSDQYRRPGEQFTPPVFAYRRKHGVSVTGGYVYRGERSPSYVGAYIFADFESKRIWALTQADRRLLKVRQIGNCPEKPASFGIDAHGELLVVGYEGTIFRLVLDDSTFE